MSRVKKTLSLILVAVMLFSVSVTAFAAEEAKYIIGNPYESVNWETWDAYKTQLHCHTNASDGSLSIAEVVEAHYSYGYDILALSDHMTVGVQWDQAPKTLTLMRLVKSKQTGMRKLEPLTSERREEIIAGVGRNGRGMLEVTQANELNGAVPQNSHLNSFFCDYGQNLIGIDGDYEYPVAQVEKLGGITFLDHLGDYTRAWAKGKPEISSSDRFVNKYSKIFLDHPSCVGTGINSGTDTHTTYDRILYDEILKKTIPYGVVPWCFTFSDAHHAEQQDRAFTVHWMSEKTTSALRTSMEDGTFFCVSRNATYELGDEFLGEGPVPMVNKVTVDQNNQSITLDVNEYTDEVVWVYDDTIIAKSNKIDLDELENFDGCYVRAYLTGPGGICYVQPFTTIREGEVLEKEEVPFTVDYSFIIRVIVTALDDILPDSSILKYIWNVVLKGEYEFLYK